MQEIRHQFALDIKKTGIQKRLHMRCGDINSQRVIAQLFAGTTAYEMDGVSSATFRAEKPDGTILFNSCTVTDQGVEYAVTSQTIAAPGDIECMITLYGTNGEALGTPRFLIEVEEAICSDSEVESTNEFTALQTAMADKAEIAGYAQSAEEARDAAAASAETAQSSATSAATTLQELKDGIAAGDFKGEKGETGAIGPQGEKGNTGDTGPKGEQGPRGEQGPQGERGPAGPQGETGPQGPKGEDGTSFTLLGLYATIEDLQAAHPIGSAGDAWAIGTQAENVVYLWDTEKNAWANIGGIKGPKGDTGDTGPQGEQGPVGTQGEKGDTGPQGPAGEKGDPGKQGPAGPQGDQGDPGATGAQGPAGTDGYTPIKGVDYWTSADIEEINAYTTSLLTNKQDKPSQINAGTTITLADNTEYRLSNVSSLTIFYPTGNFECWLSITTAASGAITITLPDSSYASSAPTFTNSDTWEVSIKDGTVIAVKVV